MRRELGRYVLHHLRPRADRRRDERGHCSVCGAESRFFFNSWILPADMTRDLGGEWVVDAFRRRESLWCGACGSSLRVRRVAAVLLEHYADKASSLADLVAEYRFGALRVAEVNSLGTAHAVLARHPRLTYSEYPDEDVMALSYADESFDLLLTSDTLEHVPDVDRALSETRRVLAPGGRHVFTVPAVPARATTRVRALVRDGHVVHAEAPQYHAQASGPLRLLSRRPRTDMLAYTDFGMDLLDRLRAAGFEPEVHFLHADDPQADAAIVFCAQAV